MRRVDLSEMCLIMPISRYLAAVGILLPIQLCSGSWMEIKLWTINAHSDMIPQSSSSISCGVLLCWLIMLFVGCWTDYCRTALKLLYHSLWIMGLGICEYYSAYIFSIICFVLSWLFLFPISLLFGSLSGRLVLAKTAGLVCGLHY